MKIGECRPIETWLAEIAVSDPAVHAWVEVNPQPALADGPLSGIPFGAKDVFETAGLATEYGSPLYAGRKGESDAAVVDHLRRRGAILLGKTHTTAFASFDPAPTRNPRFPGHTPGGSSAGSAAAVSAGMVPFALGTQTLGSILRPAAYCGICGFKPTYGRLSMDGVLPFAPSLDTVGLFAAAAADMAWLWPRAFGGKTELPAIRLARFRSDLPNTVPGDEIDPPHGWGGLTAAALLVNQYEGARTHQARYREFGTRIGAKLADLVERGLAIPRECYEEALACIRTMRTAMAAIFGQYTAILTPAAPGPPPPGLSSTGDPVCNAPWTALGVPAISIPLSAAGPPLGLQIAASWNRDDELVAIAAEIESSMI